MGDENILSGRVPADTMEEFEEFRKERNLNKSDALRRVMDEGLERKRLEEKATRINWAGYFQESMFYFFLVFAGMMMALIHGYFGLPEFARFVGGLMMLIGLAGFPYILYKVSGEVGEEEEVMDISEDVEKEAAS